MEVLSIGEKIKRTRIYKGFTLKNLCGKDLSVSKLSCIENGKIPAEDWVLRSLAEKLEIDYDYLHKEIDEQIEENIEILINSKDRSNFSEQLVEYIDIAEENGYYELAFTLIHELFNFLIEKDRLTDIISLLGRYYEITRNTNSKDRLTYYYDAAKYFCKNNECSQGLNYFKAIKDTLIKDYPDDTDLLFDAMLDELKCLYSINNYEEIYRNSPNLLELANRLNDKNKLGEAYQLLSVAFIKKDFTESKEYFNKALEIYNDDDLKKANLYHDYSLELFYNDKREEAKNYMRIGIELFPRKKVVEYTEYLITFIEVLSKNGCYDEVDTYIEEALDNAIASAKVSLMERAYYYKTKLLIANGDMSSAEMYMFLSFDLLKKYGNIKEIYDRYIDMGDIYHKMGNTEDSIKYFTLALNMKDKI
ncbi:helix-turn-helix domain-containing protein [Clostridium sp. DL1XJH146]